MPLASDFKQLPALDDRQVLIWTAVLDVGPGPRFSHLFGLLSPEEAQRAARFRFEKDRRRFTACRGILREILGTYLDTNPKTIDFSYGIHGKPHLNELAGSATNPTLSFNLSHSGGWAIYALSTSEVGVDLEVVKPVQEMEAIVERYFSASERSAFASIPPELRLKAFFSCWTRKEAFVKACGEGLSIPLDHFDVSLDPRLPARLISVRGVSGDELNWDLHSFYPSADTVGALVYPRNSRLHFLGRVT